MYEYLKSIIFALVLCMICSLLLTGANVGLHDIKAQNIRLDRQKNILISAGLLKEGEQHSLHNRTSPALSGIHTRKL